MFIVYSFTSISVFNCHTVAAVTYSFLAIKKILFPTLLFQLLALCLDW